MVKKTCVDLGLEPILAIEKREYNRFAFCHNICRPMLESSVVVVIGDWDGNSGNANVAFEYGIATALGCNIIPIRVEGENGGPFDMVALHSIIIRSGWNKPRNLASVRNRIRNALTRTQEKILLGQMAHELPKSQKKNVIELIQSFDQTLDPDELKMFGSMLRRVWYADNRVLRDPDFVRWSISVVKRFTEHKKRIRSIQYFLDSTFFEMLKAIIQYSAIEHRSIIAEDREFAKALDKIARSPFAPIYARKSALDCLIEMAMHLRRPKLLATFRLLVMDDRLNDEDYSALQIELKLKNYLVYTAAVGGPLMPLLKMVADAKAYSYSTVLQTRIKRIEEELQKP